MMKKIYHKGQVHPSPSSSSSQTLDQFSLSYLPAAILTLVVALSSQDKEVLAYILSCSSNKSSKTHLNKNNNNQPHPPLFSCYCFNCYTYYWALWDSSPNHQLIHQIIDAFEDKLVSQKKNKKKKKQIINKGLLSLDDDSHIKINIGTNQSDCCKVNDEDANGSNGLVRVDSVDGQLCDENGEKHGSHIRKMVSFIGERIWGGVWGLGD